MGILPLLWELLVVWVYYERVCVFVWICVSFSILRRCQCLFIGISVAAERMRFRASFR
jgi:hypothetical protein